MGQRHVRCGTCWFYRAADEHDDLTEFASVAEGYCQRRAPVVSRTEHGVGRFPVVLHDWWCGEFRAFDAPFAADAAGGADA